jgi:hypothetical protein
MIISKNDGNNKKEGKFRIRVNALCVIISILFEIVHVQMLFSSLNFYVFFS